MIYKFYRFIFLVLILTMMFGCGKEKLGQREELTTHRISTNEKAITNSIVDSSLVAPDFTLPRMNGEQFQLSKNRGKVVVFNIFATWCGPCIAELPDFISMNNEFPDEDVMIIGISYDVKGWSVVEPFVRKHELNYPVILDKERILNEKYYPTALPNTYVVNQEGELAHIISSPTNKKLLKPLITELLTK